MKVLYVYFIVFIINQNHWFVLYFYKRCYEDIFFLVGGSCIILFIFETSKLIKESKKENKLKTSHAWEDNLYFNW